MYYRPIKLRVTYKDGTKLRALEKPMYAWEWFTPDMVHPFRHPFQWWRAWRFHRALVRENRESRRRLDALSDATGGGV